jgi:hypothetical protein
VWGSTSQMRQLLVTIILFCSICDPASLFIEFYNFFTNDIQYKIQKMVQLPTYIIPQHHLKNHVLVELENLFIKNGACMTDYGLPKPDLNLCNKVKNRLLAKEMSYDPTKLLLAHNIILSQLNSEQRYIYDVVIQSVYDKTGECFFVYGYGRTRKTFLWIAIISHLHSEKLIVLAVASLGVASLLLPGGRTAHSRFKIPIAVDESSMCHIKRGTFLADLILECSLIIWDEALMTHQRCFESLDHSMHDILGQVNTSNFHRIFCGKAVLLGGNF